MDDFSPYDPDVVDAPEDMPRVGNDHEVLHNAKLSPDGYYNGFFHKDYEGNYAQRRHSRRHHHNRHDYVQTNDHKYDTDDLVEDVNFLKMRDHGNDTEDVPDGLDPVLFYQMKNKDHGNDTEDVPDGLDPVLFYQRKPL